MPRLDDKDWSIVDVPHDWSIEGPFGPQFASGTGYAPGGIGWYRKRISLDEAWKDRLVFVEFDGVYDHAQVWFNGHYVGGRPYGYSSFQCELTGIGRYGSDENLLAVRVDHSRFADSRWYTGSGIYRHVRLIVTDKLHVAHWGTFIYCTKVERDLAEVQIQTTIKNAYTDDRQVSLRLEILAPDGRPCGEGSIGQLIPAGSTRTITQAISVKDPILWSPQQPALYELNSTLSSGGKITDQTTTSFGIRTIRFDPDNGLLVNGRQVKIKGVCIHHDAGPLGAAVPQKVLERRLRILKSLGTNAIRTSHNPPAPELLDLCDRLGLMVMVEAFDEFTPAKNKWVSGRNVGEPARFGYAEVFREWAIRDIEDMVLRDRNHPSVILWSIGNEIDYPNDPFSHPVLGREYRPENPPAQQMVELARPLVAAVKRLDPTRPVTAALANLAMSDAVGLPQILDVVGYNYQEDRYDQDHKQYPSRVILGSENSHSYRNWTIVRDNDYVAGQFLWTGIDYLGEAGPWPNKASRAGILDLCGFKKPGAYFRQALWDDRPMVYICASAPRAGTRRGFAGLREHWNWAEGQTVNVVGYTNCQVVRLTLNGRALATTQISQALNGTLRWQVQFEPGQLKAEGIIDGKVVCDHVLRTAGKPARIELLPDTTTLLADGKDICHIEFRVVDEQGVLVPDADHQIQFELTGPAKVHGIGNADNDGNQDYKDMIATCYQGRGLAIIRSTRDKGAVEFKAACPGLASGICRIDCR
jgi:beta-galactosidase